MDFLSPHSAKEKPGSKSPNRSPNRTPNRSPNRTPNRSPNGSPTRSPNRSPMRSPGGSPPRTAGEKFKDMHSNLSSMLRGMLDSVSTLNGFSLDTLNEDDEEDEVTKIIRIYGPENGKDVIDMHNLLEDANALGNAPRRSQWQPVLKQVKPKKLPKTETTVDDYMVYMIMVILLATAVIVRLVFYHTIQYWVGLVFSVLALLFSVAICVLRALSKDLGSLPLQTVGFVLIETFETMSLVVNLPDNDMMEWCMLLLTDLCMLAAAVTMYVWFKKHDCPSTEEAEDSIPIW